MLDRFSRNCLESWFLLLVLGKIKISLDRTRGDVIFDFYTRVTFFFFYWSNKYSLRNEKLHSFYIRCPLLKIIRAAIVRIKNYNISYWKPVGRLGEPQAKEDRSDRYV